MRRLQFVLVAFFASNTADTAGAILFALLMGGSVGRNRAECGAIAECAGGTDDRQTKYRHDQDEAAAPARALGLGIVLVCSACLVVCGVRLVVVTMLISSLIAALGRGLIGGRSRVGR